MRIKSKAFTVILIGILGMIGCNGTKSTAPGSPSSPASVALVGTQHYTSSPYCTSIWTLKNTGGSTAYHVYVVSDAGTYSLGGAGQISAGDATTITSTQVRDACPALQDIRWSTSP